MIQVWGVGGALKLSALIALTMAMPVLFGVLDLGPIFIALAFGAIPVLCLVPLAYLAGFALLWAGCDGRRPIGDEPMTEERCAAGEGIWNAHGGTCVDDRGRPRAMYYPPP